MRRPRTAPFSSTRVEERQGRAIEGVVVELGKVGVHSNNCQSLLILNSAQHKMCLNMLRRSRAAKVTATSKPTKADAA